MNAIKKAMFAYMGILGKMPRKKKKQFKKKVRILFSWLNRDGILEKLEKIYFPQLDKNIQQK